MTIDERLEFLRQSTESLHASCQELHATVARQADEMKEYRLAMEQQDGKIRRHYRAVLKAMEAYLGEMGGNGDENGKA